MSAPDPDDAVTKQVVAIGTVLCSADPEERSAAVDELANLTAEVFGNAALTLGLCVRYYGMLPMLVWLLGESPEDREQVFFILANLSSDECDPRSAETKDALLSCGGSEHLFSCIRSPRTQEEL